MGIPKVQTLRRGQKISALRGPRQGQKRPMGCARGRGVSCHGERVVLAAVVREGGTGERIRPLKGKKVERACLLAWPKATLVYSLLPSKPAQETMLRNNRNSMQHEIILQDATNTYSSASTTRRGMLLRCSCPWSRSTRRTRPPCAAWWPRHARHACRVNCVCVCACVRERGRVTRICTWGVGF